MIANETVKKKGHRSIRDTCRDAPIALNGVSPHRSSFESAQFSTSVSQDQAMTERPTQRRKRIYKQFAWWYLDYTH